MDQTRLDELIEKYADGTATPEEMEELLRWYRSADIQTVDWPASQPDEREQLQQRMLHRLQQQMHQTGGRSKVLRMRGWRIAASLIVIVSATWIARQYLDLTGKPVYVTVSNPSGKIQAIRLPDSSQVWLNAASSLRYAKKFTSDRELFLDGEAYFDVTSDPRHPFVVHAGSLTTTVLGTSFDIKSFATEHSTAISVIRGKVQVADSSKVLDVLTPARQLLLNRNTHSVQTVTIDTSQVISWQQGRLQFSGQPLEEITASLGRWYNVQFSITNPAARACRYYLNFENTISLHDLLAVLGETTGLTFQLDDNHHTVTVSGGQGQCQ